MKILVLIPAHGGSKRILGKNIRFLGNKPLIAWSLESSEHVPVILAWGVGNGQQLAVGFAEPRVDAVATAHLFNFLGDGLQRARQTLIDQGANLPVWPSLDQLGLRNTPEPATA